MIKIYYLSRLSHPKPKSDGVGAILMYVVKDLKAAEEHYLKEDSSEEVKKLFKFLNSVEKVTKATASDTSEVVQLIRENNLVREHIPTQLLNERDIWMALLDKMPLMALIRNLGKMSSLGLLKEGLPGTKLVVNKLEDAESLKLARIHPFNVLVALNTYKQGVGEKGNLEWPVCREIVTALDRAFYSYFRLIRPTKRRHLLALDVSGSMQTTILGSPSITCAMGSAAMAMVTVKTEGLYEAVAFSDVLKPVYLKPAMRLEEVERALSKFNFGATDCALPMVWAEQQEKKFDVFIVYTDSETWFREIHPSEALKQYRKSSGIPDAKLIVVGMAANSFTIADPEDAGMIDIAGFDSAAPEAIRNFILGLI